MNRDCHLEIQLRREVPCFQHAGSWSLVPSTANAKQHINKIRMICCWRERWWFLISEARFEEANFTLMKALKREVWESCKEKKVVLIVMCF